MLSQFRPAISILIAMSILTGVIYPGIVLGISQLLFPHRANGSLISQNSQAIGSKLMGSEFIGQQFTDPKYFWGRVSATSPAAYNAALSSGSNLGPSNPALVASVENRIDALRQYETPRGPVPVDLVTSSASGLDPHISPAAAEYQIPRVAKLRNLNEEKLRELIRRNTQGRQLGFLGEPRVHVLKLNVELDKEASKKATHE